MQRFGLQEMALRDAIAALLEEDGARVNNACLVVKHKASQGGVPRYVILGLGNLRDALDPAICRATGLGMPRVAGTWVLREEDALQIIRYAGNRHKKIG